MDRILDQILFQHRTSGPKYKLSHDDEEEEVLHEKGDTDVKGTDETFAPVAQTITPQTPVTVSAVNTPPVDKGKDTATPVDTVDTGKPVEGGQPSGSLMKDVGEILIEKNKYGMKIEELADKLQEKGYEVSNVKGGKRGEITVTSSDGKTQVLKDTDGNGSIGMEDKEIAQAMQNSGIDADKLAKLNEMGETYKAKLAAKKGK
jgi:hypothetical protein